MGINKAKPVRAFKQLGKALLCAGSIALFGVVPQQASAYARVWSNGVGVSDFASALYRKDYVDMQVKVRGRMLKIKRRWQDDHWTLLPDIADLTFEYEQVYVEADKGFYPSVTTAGSSSGSNSSVTFNSGVKPQTVDGELITIKRGDFEYKKVEGGTDGNIIFRFTPDDKKSTQGFTNRKTITKTAEGHIWRDGTGNKIVYDTAGKIQYIEDANSNKITMLRDTQGRIEGIKDPVDEQVITITYIGASEKIEKVTDYTGRFIEYVWDGEQIARFKDVMGEYTDYGYTHHDIKGGLDLLTTVTDPMDRVTTINYHLSYGGITCIPSSPGSGIRYREEEIETDDGDIITVKTPYYGGSGSGAEAGGGCISASVPKNITMRGITLPGESEPLKTYDYFYDANNELYYHKTIHADGMVEESAINLNGETVAKYINNLRVMKATKDGNKTIIEDERGLKTTKEYDQWKNLTKVTYPDNSTKSWKYNSIDKILEKTDEEGIITKYEYDAAGNVHKRINAYGTDDQRTVEWCNQFTELEACQALKAANCTGAPSNRCSVVKYHGGIIDSVAIPDSIKIAIYDDRGNIVRFIDAEGNLTKKEDFDALGNAKKVIDATDQEWDSTFNSSGKRLTLKTPLGYVYEFSYNKSGDVDTLTDPVENLGFNDFDAKYHYNTKGQVIKVEDSYGNFSEVKYDLRGRVIERKDAEGHIMKTSYDLFGRKTMHEDGIDNKILYKYVNDGSAPYRKIESIVYPTYSKHFKYDNRGRVAKVYHKIEDDEMLLIADIKYNKKGQRVSVTDANGKETAYTYNKRGKIVSYIDADKKETFYVYDYFKNLLSITDAENSTTQFRYNKNGKKVKETRPLSGEYTYDYDARGMLESIVDPKGNKSIYEYDHNGSLDVQKNYAKSDLQNPERIVDFDYYPNGQMQGFDDGSISAQFTYDDKRRLTNELFNNGSFTKEYSYTYYKNGSKKSYTDAEGVIYDYEYNDAGQLQNLKIPAVGTYAIQKYNFLLPETVLLPGGTKKEYDYTAQMQPKQIKVSDPAQNPIMDYQYTYDKVGNVDSKTTEHGLYDYEYDNLYRLTDAINPNIETEKFTYDGVGNRKTTQDSTEQWQYNANHELQTRPQFDYSYDSNGSIEKITKDAQDTKFIYNATNRLVEVKDHEDISIAKYQYDPFGRRISKDVAGVKTYFFYTDRGLAAEYTQTGELIRGYGYKPTGKWTTDPLYQKTGGKYYFYHNDHLGTPQKLTATNGAVVWDAKYESFGKAYVQSNTIDNPLRFAGQYEDDETGFHYNFKRYYIPELGRYLSSDPIGLVGGINTYAYVTGNPLKYIDSLGLILSPLQQDIIAAIMQTISILNDPYAGVSEGDMDGPAKTEQTQKRKEDQEGDKGDGDDDCDPDEPDDPCNNDGGGEGVGETENEPVEENPWAPKPPYPGSEQQDQASDSPDEGDGVWGWVKAAAAGAAVAAVVVGGVVAAGACAASVACGVIVGASLGVGAAGAGAMAM